MSLETASTTLDTAWTEFSTIDYTAGSLPDLDACVLEVQSKLKRGILSASTTPSTTDIKRWLQRAKQELAEIRKFTWRDRYVTASLTAGTFRYALPPDFDGGTIVIRDIEDDVKLKIVSGHVFDTLYPDVDECSNGQILCAAIKGRELWVAPPPDSNNTIELRYSRSGDDITETDFSWLPEIERFRCCDFACAEAFSSLRDVPMAQFYYTRWQGGVMKANRSDGKRKWSRVGYRARSVFQA